jgi:CDP-diacylglycerol--glycerol-3-phosphate 3-phosphatidyltransferase
LDGAIARHLGTVGPRGALIDSVSDRISESVFLLGLLVHFTSPQTSLQTASILAFVALIGSLVVSYIRARAEGLGLEGKAGFLTRAERVIITIGALLVNQPLVLLWILAIGTPISAIERFISVWILAGKSSTNKD